MDYIDIDNLDTMNVRKRLSQDSIINDYGRQLINLCISNNLLIVTVGQQVIR